MTLPTPYWEGKGAVLHLGDCREVIPALPTGSVELVVTDPPYGQSFRSNFGRNFNQMAGDDSTDWLPAVIAMCARLMRSHRHLYVFGRPDLTGLPYSASVELIWDKAHKPMGDLSSPWGTSHEPIQFMVKVSGTKDRLDGKGNLAARLRRETVIRVPRLNAGQNRRHPTEKPVLLLRHLIESSSVLGETVFDPFAGSGSTLEAALREGRKAVGIEVDERYCEAIARRLDKLVVDPI